jgi:O-methyltransferase domain/Dimerisation domain
MKGSDQSQQLLDLIIGSWVSRSIHAAAKLRIADQLADGPKSADELAEAVMAAPGPLHRLLRALTGVGVFRQADGRFHLNPLAEFLLESRPDSLWAVAVLIGDQDRCWGDLLETVRTGEVAFDRLYGRPIFDFYDDHPEQARVFDRAMAEFSGRETKALLDAYDFSGVGTLADIGGGTGTRLAAILGRHPAMRGVLFDVPRAAERARATLETAGVSDRCAVRAGDFFRAAPGGADAYLLGHILHDWDDAEAGLILDTVRRAAAPGAKLLVVEYVASDGDGAPFAGLIDLHMMLLTGGLERTEVQYRHLLAGHGFRLTRVVPAAGSLSVVEGVRD